MKYRNWTYKDILKISELEKACFSDPWNYRMFADAFSSKLFHGVLAEENGEVVGYACQTVLFENAEVDNVAVAENSRRRGMGKTLLKKLEKETDDNFRAQGRPRWKPLSQATILNRLMGKTRDGKSKGIASILRKDGNLLASAQRKLDGGLAILQDTGVLRGSIRVYSDRDSVTIGAARVKTKAGTPMQYAAIHQFGGMAGRGKKVRIPARPFIPVDRDGNLSPEAERGVLAAIYDHLAESV